MLAHAPLEPHLLATNPFDSPHYGTTLMRSGKATRVLGHSASTPALPAGAGQAPPRHRCMGVERGPLHGGDAGTRRAGAAGKGGGGAAGAAGAAGPTSCTRAKAANPRHRSPSGSGGSGAPRGDAASPCLRPASAAPLQGPHARTCPLVRPPQPVGKRPGLPRNAACISPGPAGTAGRHVRAVPAGSTPGSGPGEAQQG
ncbi:cuticle collagen 2-like [Manacus candei]|uniref:cuticle collagen 2-like n=1 Tax=Manacus candei TaxID=415023 RepID=UPI00222746C5|nr:cuticle collagen 2-like [Manacus candei]